jgi:molybdopterin/thiamine biosynthesis adenylyltransferase
MNQNAFYRRIADIFSPEKLRCKEVAIVGLGSGGSRVATELARLGVALTLVERPGEMLQEHNLVRHALGYPSLGKPKLAEMARQLPQVNPYVAIRTWELDVVEESERFQAHLAEARPSVIAVCTDSEESKHAINSVACSLRIPQTGGGVYDGGIGGEVYLVRPDQACYGCIATRLQLSQPRPRREAVLDYGHLELEELRSTCALNMDIQQIALLQARLTLNLLLDGCPDLVGLPPDVNVCVFANRAFPGTFARPWHAEFFSIPRSADCLICGEVEGDLEGEATRIEESLRMRDP